MDAEPIATYRLQLGGELDFSVAASLTEYLAELGVSHLYCSPVMRATPGSTHGYDVTDPTCPNPELGGLPGFRLLSLVARERGLGLLLDIVPNHMAITGPENRWWWDVLENGPSSRFASFFDVDWSPPDPRLTNRILLPVLPDHYGRVLERGEIGLRVDGGRFVVAACGGLYPLAPRSADGLLREAARRTGSPLLGFLADAHGELPPSHATDLESVERRHRDKEVLAESLARLFAAEPATRGAVQEVVDETNRDFGRLHALLERQNYRLARWRTAASRLDYRRFFDVNHLIGIRVEDPRVFAQGHERVIDWLASGDVDGVRVDHVDGLRDPEGYLAKLAAAAPGGWVVVEKILARDERLPAAWCTAGTSGYDFLARTQGVFIDPQAEPSLSETYRRTTGDARSWDEVLLASKARVLRELFGSDLERLTEIWAQAVESDPRHRDLERAGLRRALAAFLIALPVYRTYLREEHERPTPSDAAVLERTVAVAREREPSLEPEIFDLLERMLRRELRGPLETELVLRLQQLGGAVMAKGMEDTAGYAYPRFAALCEVGCDPSAFGESVDRFHAANREAQARHPRALLASSTHDTKRSEDVRARLVLLSEIPELWRTTCERWFERNARHRGAAGPDAKAEYLLYQTLVGAWPIDAERLVAYCRKAAREAKEHTSWLAPEAAYEADLERFVREVAGDPAFREDLEGFVAPLVEPGRRNALSMTLLKLACPGVPDLYQGCELWDHSLVDPDNRRPVDFAQRGKLLVEVKHATARYVLRRWDDGLPKLFVIQRVLAERRRTPERFDSRSGYRPLAVSGPAAEHAIAFARKDLVCLVPRFPLRFPGDWGDTRVTLSRGPWRDVLSDQMHRGGSTRVRDLLAGFPVALLTREGDA